MFSSPLLGKINTKLLILENMYICIYSQIYIYFEENIFAPVETFAISSFHEADNNSIE